MRDVLCRNLIRKSSVPEFIFLTGDVGFNALEPLRDALDGRFINAGVAEQNMISVAAGLAKSGMRPWVYSIAPFIYARPFEQIRNDICLPDLPVVLVGNGGGYGYGVMGSSHHALEDYGALLTLQNMRVFIPAFDSDVLAMADQLLSFNHPAYLHPTYLRLGISELPKHWDPPEYAAWRCLLKGHGPTMLVAGPIVGGLLDRFSAIDEDLRPSIWVITEFPFIDPPYAFLDDLTRSGHLFVVEEHVVQGGLGQMISYLLLSGSAPLPRFTHRCARGYVSGLYGSQAFHRQECGLDPESILEAVLPSNSFSSR